MKCHCDECNGCGSIPCPECSGNGTVEGNIETVQLVPSMRGYDELRALQRDAIRAIKQATRLTELNPSRSSSYEAQLRATLFVINGQAEEAAK